MLSECRNKPVSPKVFIPRRLPNIDLPFGQYRIDTNSIAMEIIENTYLKSIEWSNAVIPQKYALQ